ncbi:Flp pilus assembly protein CpaB [Nocardiopsis suaedae]|uniref:Flp pilus assembly protein CpaB n=1 Tax=Nocardiopsis suaedae TaxID=3018444 RepID=A0ABT4TRD1_9ACTN|nr:Flp pilus assembly protein CpaB [Nocardiopsis suaedae]MDA2807264.1 Flp pilus assembly protein CpaB [Nocardiopsis suaedae]
MNPRQRRGVLLMIIAAVGAIAVGFAVISHSASLQAEMGTYRTALRLTQDVEPYQQISEDMVEEYKVPAKFFDEETFLGSLESEELRTPVAATFISKGSLLQTSMIVAAPDLEQGERELAIMIDAETGVAGKVQRQSRVDVYASFQPSDRMEDACQVRVLTNIEVLDVGELASEVDEETGGTNSVVPITFRLTPQDALKLGYAESFASGVRLGLISPEGTGSPGNIQYCSAEQYEEIQEQSGGGGDSEDDEEAAEDGQETPQTGGN